MSARFGLLVPSINTVVESDMYRMAPIDVAFATARLSVSTLDISDEAVVGQLDSIAESVEETVGMLPLEKLKGIAFCCTGASFYRGGDWDRTIAARIENLAHVPAVTTSGAVLEALRYLGVHRIAVASPYVEALNRQLTGFLEANGCKVVHLSSLQTKNAYKNAAHSREVIIELVREADAKEAEAIFVPCTNLPATELVDDLESLVGKPVVCANQATFWHALRSAGIPKTLLGLGSLFGT